VGEAKPDRHEQQRIAAADTSSEHVETENTIKLIKNIIEADNLDQAEILIENLMQKYPYEGEPHMLMGDILMRRQEPVKAVLEYKEAIGLNPDYLDKKTPLFQGKKLKVAVGEALAEVDKRMRLNPSDESMKNNRKTIYFLQRKIAGSCS
jgi:tetratricopeptide (TPR) repeat protein